MKQAKIKGDFKELVGELRKFINQSSGLFEVASDLQDYFTVEQKTDGHRMTFNLFDLEEILPRVDEYGKGFLQVNFGSGKKVLFTETLVGFRPLGLFGLDMEKLPKVVTTADLQSIFEAIQESLQCGDEPEELDVLRKVFDSVVCGGESIGFNLDEERQLFSRIPTTVLSGAA